MPERALVIVPTYNEQANIRRLVDSVLARPGIEQRDAGREVWPQGLQRTLIDDAVPVAGRRKLEDRRANLGFVLLVRLHGRALGVVDLEHALLVVNLDDEGIRFHATLPSSFPCAFPSGRAA